MTKSRDDVKYEIAHARLLEDEALRVGSVAGTSVEVGMDTNSEQVDLFSSLIIVILIT